MAHDKHILRERAAILALATVVCAVLTFVTGVAVLRLSLPLDDPDRSRPWFRGAVIEIGGPLCLVCALLAYPLMLWGLSRTKLALSLPVVFAVSIGTIAATARLGPLAAGFSLVFAAIAMGICRKLFRERAPRSFVPGHRHGAIAPVCFGAAAGMLLFPIAFFVVSAAMNGARAIPASTILLLGVPIGGVVGAVAGWCLAVAAADPDETRA